MPTEEPPESEESNEKQLCIRCLVPNEPSAHFCVKCGTPLTSYASTGPFESLFAEGSIYRNAAEQPRKPIVLLGMWLIFGCAGIGSLVLILMARESGIYLGILGAVILVVSIAMLWKTTRNFFAQSNTSPAPPFPSDQ